MLLLPLTPTNFECKWVSKCKLKELFLILTLLFFHSFLKPKITLGVTSHFKCNLRGLGVIYFLFFSSQASSLVSHFLSLMISQSFASAFLLSDLKCKLKFERLTLVSGAQHIIMVQRSCAVVPCKQSQKRRSRGL